MSLKLLTMPKSKLIGATFNVVPSWKLPFVCILHLRGNVHQRRAGNGTYWKILFYRIPPRDGKPRNVVGFCSWHFFNPENVARKFSWQRNCVSMCFRLGMGEGGGWHYSPQWTIRITCSPEGHGFWAVYVGKRRKFWPHWTEIGCVFHSGLALSIFFTRNRLLPHYHRQICSPSLMFTLMGPFSGLQR